MHGGFRGCIEYKVSSIAVIPVLLDEFHSDCLLYPIIFAAALRCRAFDEELPEILTD